MNEKKRKFAENALRRGAFKWPPRYMAKVDARVARGKYRCAKCSGVFRDKEGEVDHLDPVVNPLKGQESLDIYADRLLADSGGWQWLCKPCHQDKSQRENEVRREVKKNIDFTEEKE
jgi:5-methylcytosine-specific restriction endonuclease McrA